MNRRRSGISAHQLIAGRPIVGVTFRVRSAQATARYLVDAGFNVRADADANGVRRVLVTSSDARGLWPEFREDARRLPAATSADPVCREELLYVTFRALIPSHRWRLEE